MTVLRTSVRNFMAHKGRMALSGTAVLLSVAFVCGTLVFTGTMTTTFDKLFARTASDVMVGPVERPGGGGFDVPSAVGKPDTVPAALAEEVAAVPGVERVTGTVSSPLVVVVDAANENIGPTTGAPTIASAWSEVELRSMEVREGAPPRGPDEIMVDADTAGNKGLAVGDPLRVLTAFGDFPVRISGIAAFTVTNPGATVLYFEGPVAQQVLLGGEDAYTELYVDGDGSRTDEELRDAVAAAVGAEDYRLRTAQEYADDSKDAIGEVMSVLRYVLLGFAGIALLVGVFLIVNTFSMLVAQRTREIGLLRAIGSGRGQVNRSVLIEALLLGLIGSVLGFGAGIGLAVGLMVVLREFGMNLSTDDLTIGWSVPVIGVVLGTVVTLLAAYIPARRAGKITPMAALREAGTPGDVRAGRVRAAVGGVLAVGGLGLLAATATVDAASQGWGYLALGIVLSLLGLILVAPALVGLVVRVLGVLLLRVFGPVGRLAERNALRNPRRTGATASALMIGLALVSALSVVGASMVSSATDEIDRSVGADFMISPVDFGPVLPDVGAAVAGVRESDGGPLASVTEYRMLSAEITTAGGRVTERQLSAAQPSMLTDLTVGTVAGDLERAYERDGIAVDADAAAELGIGVGDELTVSFERGASAVLTVRAITEKSTLEGGTWALSLETARAHVPDEALPLPLMLFVTAQDGRADEARTALETALEPYPQMELLDQYELKEQIRAQIGQLLNMVYGLLALAVIVAVLGVVNTLALAVVERTREIGLMRAIGLSRRQLRRMIRLESVVIALFGALLGTGLGLAWGAAAQRLMALEGMPVLEIPWPVITAVFAGAALVGLVAALAPAFRAGRMNILTAIATE
ncbi:ABC transporter permease [Streptomyces sp. NRRL F-2890]|uniref:ABC transporter permease n=1 Tax=Streptomyces sp. NRRL F-2890 TaxID=1463845 RepID=UPI0004C7CD71|nr:ABC transporter permease [Streptomyces sp. NRRL F-2890]